MVYEPSKSEVRKLNNLNKGYLLIKEGLKLIKANLPKKDRFVEMETFKLNKNFEKIIKRIRIILESEYIDKEFLDIINNKKPSTKKNRLKKKDKEGKKRTKTKPKKKKK